MRAPESSLITEGRNSGTALLPFPFPFAVEGQRLMKLQMQMQVVMQVVMQVMMTTIFRASISVVVGNVRATIKTLHVTLLGNSHLRRCWSLGPPPAEGRYPRRGPNGRFEGASPLDFPSTIWKNGAPSLSQPTDLTDDTDHLPPI